MGHHSHDVIHTILRFMRHAAAAALAAGLNAVKNKQLEASAVTAVYFMTGYVHLAAT